MFEKLKQLWLLIERERQRQRAIAQQQGIRLQPFGDPGDEPGQVFWLLVAGLGCRLVGRGNWLQARAWPRPSPLGAALIGAGRTLRRRALTVAKSVPCV